MIVSDEQFGASYQIMNVIFVVVAVIGKYPQSDILIEESPNVTVDDNSTLAIENYVRFIRRVK